MCRLTSMGSEMPLADAVKVSLKLLYAMRPHGLTLPSLGRPGWLPWLPRYSSGLQALLVLFLPPSCFESSDLTYLQHRFLT